MVRTLLSSKDMKKKITVLALCAMFFALGFAAEAQQPKKVPRIGYLTSTSLSSQSATREAFQQGLRELGYTERKNIVIEWRAAEGNRDRQRELAAELVRLQVDVIVATSTTIALVAKSVTRTIPIVFLSAAEPVASGLVDSLARPGGNLTGFATIAAVLAGKRLELLKETVPKLSRVAVLWEPKNRGRKNRGKKASWRLDN